MSNKQIVTFGRFVGWNEHPSGAIQALLGDIEGHYRLGSEPMVRTSAVLRIEYSNPELTGSRQPIEIETLNTIYRVREEELT